VDGGEFDGRHAERLRDILAIIEHLQTINRSMLDRLRPMALGHVPLEEMLGQLLRERSRQHPQISFSFTAGKLQRSYGDSIDLTVYRCIQESLTNVIRHAQAKHVGVDLRHVDAKPWLALTVRDDGCGIPPEILPRIFEPFLTTKETGRGVGLGLAISHSILERHNGNIEVQSEVGRGTTFTVTLPWDADAEKAAPRPGTENAVTASGR